MTIYIICNSGGRKIPKPGFEIPWTVFWLHHEMVLQLAQGCIDCSRTTLLRSLPNRVLPWCEARANRPDWNYPRWSSSYVFCILWKVISSIPILFWQKKNNILCSLHLSRFRRQVYVTPKSFLSFLMGYKMIYSTKLREIQILAKRMNVGLGKLLEAAESVELLRKDLEIKEKDISIANNEAEVVSLLFY